MSEIELKRANVVKRVDSEDKAKALEAKGFVRTDGTVANKTESNAAYEAVINELKEQLLKAGKVIEASDARRGELEKELTSTKEKLEEASKYAEEADKKIATLEAELSGTKEQLEAALKKIRLQRKIRRNCHDKGAGGLVSSGSDGQHEDVRNGRTVSQKVCQKGSG